MEGSDRRQGEVTADVYEQMLISIHEQMLRPFHFFASCLSSHDVSTHPHQPSQEQGESVSAMVRRVTRERSHTG